MVRLGNGVFLNINMVIVGTCLVAIGAPNPALKSGTAGPELGKKVHIEEDCWLGGNLIVCPAEMIGRGSTTDAASMVTEVASALTPNDYPVVLHHSSDVSSRIFTVPCRKS